MGLNLLLLLFVRLREDVYKRQDGYRDRRNQKSDGPGAEHDFASYAGRHDSFYHRNTCLSPIL